MSKSKKIKKWIAWIAIIVVALLSILSWYLVDRVSYSKLRPFFPVTNDKDTGLTIGIIGASWAAAGKMDSILHYNLLEQGIPNRIISSGQPGANTKSIYQNLFRENKEPHSSKFIIEARPRYCIVMGGGNDAVSQLGAKFYAYHMMQIIKTMLHYKIYPIVVSAPEVGIKQALDGLNFFSKYRNIITGWFTNHGEINCTRAYRKAFEEELVSANLRDSILLFDFDRVCADYNKCTDLYANPTHLNLGGYEKFCHAIMTDLLGKIHAH